MVTTAPIRSILWLAFFGAIMMAWAVMFSMARMSGLDWLGRPVGMTMMPMESFGTLAAMWAIMMAAMMLPTLVPTLLAYDDLTRSIGPRAGATRAGWLGVLAGYFAVWIGMALLLGLVQVSLLRAGAVDGLGIATSAWLAGGLLVAVGAYQFSRSKEICHGVCRAPMTHFLGHWRPGWPGGLRMGAGLGLFCAGCCWGIMALGFVGGTMSLLWMGAATLFMVAEKLPALGDVVTRPAGVALIAAGAGLIAYEAVNLI